MNRVQKRDHRRGQRGAEQRIDADRYSSASRQQNGEFLPPTRGSSIDSDNGFNADLDFSPWKYMDVDFGYTHSVHFQLDTLSFSVGFNLSPLLRWGGTSRN